MVLLVEDTDDLRELFATALEAAGYIVLQAQNGRAALDLLTALPGRPSAIVVDVMMPVMSGPELISLVRAEPRFAAVPIIVITALPSRESRELDGAACVLWKPFAPAQLVSAVGECCSGIEA